MNPNDLEKKLRLCLSAFWITLAIGFAVSLGILIISLDEHNAFSQDLCLKPKCIDNFLLFSEHARQTFNYIASSSVAALTAIGIYFAIMNYIGTARTNAISNHLSNLRTFNDFINQEITNDDRIKIGSIDVFRWYNLIFPKSKSGNLSIGEEYKRLISEIDNAIKESNKLCTSGDSPSFEYKPHQEKMREALKKIGITIELMPRNDFKDSEKSLYKIIDKTNKEFCGSNEIVQLSKPKYF